MSKKPTRASSDTRGLPEGYDPHKFYEYRLNVRAGQARGVEGFLYEILGKNVIRSFAYAIDPFSMLKTSTGKVTPITRTRKRESLNVLNNFQGTWSYSRYSHALSDGENHNPNSPFIENFTLNNTRQDGFPTTIKDTTNKTRVLGSAVGEFENFKYSINSPGRSYRYSYINDTFYHPGGQRHYNDVDNQTWSYTSPSATYPQWRFNEFFNKERDITLATMQDNAVKMYKGILPSHRNYTLFRNLVELRDLPRSVNGLKQTVENFARLDASLRNNAKLRRLLTDARTSILDIPKEYIGYHFGWKQTYRDIMDLMSTPEKISRQIDLMIKRNGLASTYRTSRIIPVYEKVSNGFEYERRYFREDHVSTEHEILRNVELRMVVNATIQFPTTNVPSFRNEEFIRKLGVVPSFTDLYNLVPWTWLVDWFTGFGDYLEVIENINGDKNLINWGLITGKTVGSLKTTYNSKVTSFRHIALHPDWAITSNPVQHYSHSTTMDYSFQIRKDLATIMDVKTPASPSSLTGYQQSILAALFSQRLRTGK